MVFDVGVEIVFAGPLVLGAVVEVDQVGVLGGSFGAGDLDGLVPRLVRAAVIAVVNNRLGKRAWTVSAAERAANRAPRRPRPEDKPEERAARVHELTRDEHVATAVAGQLLRRPGVAGKVMANPDTRRQLYRAQADHDQQAQEAARERTPAMSSTACTSWSCSAWDTTSSPASSA